MSGAGPAEPLRWSGAALELLDQTALPREEVRILCESPSDVAAAIARLAVRGAPAIGIAAAYGAALAVRGAADPKAALAAAAEELRAARPTAVNLTWALDRCSEALAAAPTGSEAGAVLECAHSILRAQDAADRAMAAAGAALLEGAGRVLTHCNTGPLATGGYGTAGGILRAAFERGGLEEVWVSETRPLLQGARLTAWELGRLGIPHRVIPDAAAASLMGRGLVDAVVVGADRIAANGDVANKVGTYAHAVSARHHGIPLYVAAPISTLDPATAAGSAIVIEERPPEEVTTLAGTPVAPPASPASNWAFDVTPATLVSAIVTEAGVLRPPLGDAIARALGDISPRD